MQCPNALYDAATGTFNAQVDCVGYLTRLLSVTGDTSAAGNAYLNLINTIHTAHTAPFAARGYVATAYEFAVAFPTLGTGSSAGWQYLSGNVEPGIIDTYNHTKVASLNTYNGVRKGGFAAAQASDVLAFGYSAASSSNGHIMVLEKSPQLMNADSLRSYFPAQSTQNITALLAARNVYAVSVFDCSGQQAHFRDSRVLYSGIGHGVLMLLTDKSDDAPAASSSIRCRYPARISVWILWAPVCTPFL